VETAGESAPSTGVRGDDVGGDDSAVGGAVDGAVDVDVGDDGDMGSAICCDIRFMLS